MQIFVSTASKGVITLDVSRNTPVWMVKAMLTFYVGMDVEEQRIIFGGKQLEDGRTLRDYDICKECSTHLLGRMRGGMYAQINGRDGFLPVTESVETPVVSSSPREPTKTSVVRYKDKYLDVFLPLDARVRHLWEALSLKFYHNGKFKLLHHRTLKELSLHRLAPKECVISFEMD